MRSGWNTGAGLPHRGYQPRKYTHTSTAEAATAAIVQAARRRGGTPGTSSQTHGTSTTSIIPEPKDSAPMPAVMVVAATRGHVGAPATSRAVTVAMKVARNVGVTQAAVQLLPAIGEKSSTAKSGVVTSTAVVVSDRRASPTSISSDPSARPTFA